MKYANGFKACTYGCLGLGNCVRACPFEAITIGPGGLPVVDQENATVAACARACPKDHSNITKRRSRTSALCANHDRGRSVTQACEVGCMACKACVKACPQEAITMQDNLAVIDLEKCDDCGECVAACKPGTIHPRRNLPVASTRPQDRAAV